VEFVTGKAAATNRRITLIAAVALSVLFGLLSVPFLFSGYHLGELGMIAIGLWFLAVSMLTWLLPFPEGRAGVRLLSLADKGIVVYPAAQWAWRPVQIDLGWSQVEKLILRKPPRGRPNIAIVLADAAPYSLNLRPPTWQNRVLARWTKPTVVVLAGSFDCEPEALLDELAKAARAAGRTAQRSGRWDGGTALTLADG